MCEDGRGAASYLFGGRALYHVAVQPRLHGFVIALEKFKEQFLLAAEIRIERAACITRGLRDFFHTPRDKPLLYENNLRGIEQSLARLLAGLVASESFGFHVFIRKLNVVVAIMLLRPRVERRKRRTCAAAEPWLQGRCRKRFGCNCLEPFHR